MKFKALPGRVIAQLHTNIHQEHKTDGGIIVPENEKRVKEITYWKAVVLDSAYENVKIGDVIVFGKYAGSTLIDDQVSVVGDDILGTL